MTPGDAAGTSFTMTCGTTDYPFRADEPADAEAWVAVISKRMAQTIRKYTVNMIMPASSRHQRPASSSTTGAPGL